MISFRDDAQQWPVNCPERLFRLGSASRLRSPDMERILYQYSSNKSSVLQINTICFAKKNSTFKQTQSDLQIQNSIWEKMQRYGQIYTIVCYNCETRLPFYEETWADFLSGVQADFLTRAIEQLSFPKTADDAVGQFTLVSRDPKHLFTFSDQYEWGTGEFMSYYLYN